MVIGPEVADPVAAIKAKLDEIRAGASALPPHVIAAADPKEHGATVQRARGLLAQLRN